VNDTNPRDDIVRSRARELARRLNLLQDWYASEHDGKPMTFTDFRRALKRHGTHVSEGRWAYMLTGDGSLTTDINLLTAIAAVYGVDPVFLLDWEDQRIPQKIAARRELVKTIRENKLTRVAARSLGPLTPESHQAITHIIEAQMNRDFGTE
jgi:hypothetical protein